MPDDLTRSHKLNVELETRWRPKHLAAVGKQGSTTVCRVIVDPEPLAGSVNMAIDAALLKAADLQPASPVVRVYRWSEPTVSLGYFQKSDVSMADRLLSECPKVRRLTGGGAILHHHDLTYSCVIPRTHPISDEPVRLYHLLHRAISRLLQICGANVGFRTDFPLQTHGPERCATVEPDLCFLRSDPRDLAAYGVEIVGHPKITGSAQRRRRGTILQHGSILLKSSTVLPSVPGLCNLFPAFDLAKLASMLPARLAASICDDQCAAEYTDQESQFAFESLKPVASDLAGRPESAIEIQQIARTTERRQGITYRDRAGGLFNDSPKKNE